MLYNVHCTINGVRQTLPNHQIPVKVFLTLIHLPNFHNCSKQVNQLHEKTLFGKARQVFMEA